jgi:PAS domain S-box-containing protein
MLEHMSRQGSQMVDLLPVPAYLWDINTERFFAANRMFLDLVGYTQSELFQLDWRDLVHPKHIEVAQRAITVGAIMDAVTWDWKRKDGTLMTVTLASRAMSFIDDDDSRRNVYFAVVLNVDQAPPLPAEEAFPS